MSETTPDTRTTYRTAGTSTRRLRPNRSHQESIRKCGVPAGIGDFNRRFIRPDLALSSSAAPPHPTLPDALQFLSQTGRNDSGFDIGLREVLALKQQWLVGGFCQRVAEAVSDVERGPVAAFAKSSESLDRGHGLLRRHRGHFDVGERQEPLDHGAAGLAFAAFDDTCQLNAGDGGDQPGRGLFDRGGIGGPFGLTEQDCDHGGRIDHHQRHSPVSS